MKSTQLDVAVRQLCTAIRMFFAEEDDFAIYSLARNAEEIISVLLKKKGLASLWNKMLDENIKPEYREEVRKWFDDERNDLKHARHNEDDEVAFHAGGNELFLFISANALHMYYQEIFLQHEELLLLTGWCRIHHPQIFQNPIIGFEHFSELSRKEFWTEHRQIVADLQKMKTT